ncbi:GntR family transcriptional regulator [Aquabacterium sp. J223]|uniref:GntR family transcriptional regulator n=1 Tax=Aquabacterium sp. J223 TaxID=2898431 RepID=UPI0021ADEA59|nr:GntR family transcriptional regulator [Aquabacterium sp. J223]UUX97244.1 GntR family transcriptional regulator [Aquabacterium sp. J223]
MPTLVRTTYERLRADVLSGRLEPGRRLLTHELRQRYQVGASPLREALNRLASEAWVVHSDQRGFSVAGVSAEALTDLVNTRIAVESLALEQAFAHHSAEWEEALLIAFHRLMRSPRSTDPDSFEENAEWEALHRGFHRTLLSGCGSPLLLGICEQLYDQAYRYRKLVAPKAYKQRNEGDEHRAVFNAVMARRLDDAKRLLGDHYRTTADLFLRRG